MILMVSRRLMILMILMMFLLMLMIILLIVMMINRPEGLIPSRVHARESGEKAKLGVEGAD